MYHLFYYHHHHHDLFLFFSMPRSLTVVQFTTEYLVAQKGGATLPPQSMCVCVCVKTASASCCTGGRGRGPNLWSSVEVRRRSGDWQQKQTAAEPKIRESAARCAERQVEGGCGGRLEAKHTEEPLPDIFSPLYMRQKNAGWLC